MRGHESLVSHSKPVESETGTDVPLERGTGKRDKKTYSRRTRVASTLLAGVLGLTVGEIAVYRSAKQAAQQAIQKNGQDYATYYKGTIDDLLRDHDADTGIHKADLAQIAALEAALTPEQRDKLASDGQQRRYEDMNKNNGINDNSTSTGSDKRNSRNFS